MRLAPDVHALIDPLLQPQASIGAQAVAFDADGTLWRGDVGEDLMRFLASEGHLPRHRGRSGVYAEYERRVAVDPADAYAYAVEVMADMEHDGLLAMCREFFARRYEGRLLPWVRPMLRRLHEAGHQVWIVSASPAWPVVAAAEALGVSVDRVVGVDCERDGGRLTGRVMKPVPCGEGKVHWLRERGVRPALAVGNGDLDLPMLAYAERGIVVAPHGEDNALVREARVRGWPIQRY